MDAIEAIFTRHSIDSLKPDFIPREIIEQLLSAAVQAPNHFKVHPWRFVVIQGKARDGLGDAMAETLKRKTPDVPAEALEKERQKAFRSPLIIAVGTEPSEDPRVIEIENICACAAAVENLLLAATCLGLGVKWRTTGTGAYEPEVKRFLGFGDNQHIVAILYIGYPNRETTLPDRPTFEDHTLWMDGGE